MSANVLGVFDPKDLNIEKHNPSLIQKFNEAKKRLADAKLNKSGHNTFSKYDYFELGDFLPIIIQAEQELGFANLVSFPIIDGVTTALLTVCDATSDRTLSFTSPVADASTKGASPIQAIGSMHTYMRRYLYVMAYEIAEHDAVDEADQKQEPKPETGKYAKVGNDAPPKTGPKPDPKPIDDKAHVAGRIFKLMYPDAKDMTKEGRGAPNGFTFEVYSTELSAYNKLDKTVKSLNELTVDQLKDMEQKMKAVK